MCVFASVSLFQHLRTSQLFRCYQATAIELSRSTAVPTNSRASPPGHLSWRNSTAWSFGSSTVGKYSLVYITDTRGECFLSWLLLAPCSRACLQQKRAHGTGCRMRSRTTIPALPPHPCSMLGLLTENTSLSGLGWLPGQQFHCWNGYSQNELINLNCTLSRSWKPGWVWWLLCARTPAVGWWMQGAPRRCEEQIWILHSLWLQR